MNSKIILIAACGAALLASCNKGGDTPSLPTPPQDSAACTVTPKSNDVEINVAGKTLILGSVNFLRSGRYSIDCIIEREIVPNSTKADSHINHYVYTGRYTESGGLYTLTGDINTTMSLIMKKDADTPTLQSEILVEGTASVEVNIGSVPGGSLEDFLYRSWTLKTLVMKVKGVENNISIDLKWNFTNGKNVSLVAKDLKDQGIKIDVEKFSKYDVNEISFGANNVTVSFTDNSVSDFSGTFNVAGSLAQANFSYNLTNIMPEDNPFLNAQASGTVTFPNNDIVMSVAVTTSQLEGTVELTLTAAN